MLVKEPDQNGIRADICLVCFVIMLLETISEKAEGKMRFFPLLFTR